jgi:hypothetical protein
MTDRTAEFFDGLANRGSEPLLGRIAGRVRVEIRDGSEIRQWVVAIKDGDIAVSEGDGQADCLIRADRKSFEAVASGQVNAMAASLRGMLTLEGDPRIIARFGRLFPPPTGLPKASGARSVGKRRG